MKKLGLIINPVAGLGGAVGLKGTDNLVEEAIRRCAKPRYEERVKRALKELLSIKNEMEIYTYRDNMGEKIARDMGYRVKVLKDRIKERTSSQDTIELSKKLMELNVDLILFAGGDGTARDLYKGIGNKVVVLGIPTGVKIHSPVYAVSPESAGKLAKLYLMGEVKDVIEEEVLDIDEDEYRREIINTKLYGYLTIPKKRELTQNKKAPSPMGNRTSAELIARQIIDDMEEDIYYLIGAGTTTRAIMDILGLKNTLIGVDLIKNKKVIKNDIYGSEILKYIGDEKTKLIITITGGQGFLFGRGNQQLTAEVLRKIKKNNIVIISTKEKLIDLKFESLKVDTNDLSLDKELSGYYKVVVGYGEYFSYKVGK